MKGGPRGVREEEWMWSVRKEEDVERFDRRWMGCVWLGGWGGRATRFVHSIDEG